MTGFFYFIFCWSLDLGDGTKVIFMTLMLFLPGLTFPLTTSYYKTTNTSLSDIRKISHLTLSVLIYHGSVWLFSGEGRIKYITVLAGLLGSLTFLLATKYILKNNISLIRILLTSVLSGLAFLQYEWNGRQGLYIGISVFLWTLINGLTLNVEYRKATYR
ncbi:MAG: hypothetical protein IPM42_14065 [Saprospiraceae bacterium]|nr:hypothetical protein [Saprospiraceae bacterium]